MQVKEDKEMKDIVGAVEKMSLRQVIHVLEKEGIDYDFDCDPKDFEQYCRNLLVDFYVWVEFK